MRQINSYGMYNQGVDRFVQWSDMLENPHGYDQWEDAAIPSWLRNADFQTEQFESKYRHSLATTQLAKAIASLIPGVGSFVSGLIDIPISVLNKASVENTNRKNLVQARYADWYNSPQQQIKRLKAAGLNPYMQSYVKSYAANVPTMSAYQHPVQSVNLSSPSQMLNALTNYQLSGHKAANLDSMTAINEFKVDNLLPQLFDKNGYINSILELESNWVKENYNYEHQLEQNILETRYTFALAQLGQEIMKLQPMYPNARTIINPVEGTVTYIDTESGKELDLSQMPLSQWPIYLQEAYNNMFLTMARTNDANAHAGLNDAMSSTQSALACLYNWQSERVYLDVEAYNRTGVWATDDPVLRWAAGLIPDQTHAYKVINNLFFDDSPYSKLLRSYITRKPPIKK